MKAIEFLRTLFNWKAILATKDIIQEIFIDSVDHMKRSMSREKIQPALLQLIGVTTMKPADGPSLSAESASAKDTPSPALDEARGVQGEMMMQKSRDGISSITSSAEAPKQIETEGDPFDFIKRLPAFIPQLAELSPADLMDKLLALAKDSFEAAMRLFVEEIVTISTATFELVDWGMKLL